jgi:hypothetical protein
VSFSFFFSFSETAGIGRCGNSRKNFHCYAKLQENNYQSHSKNSELKTIAKKENE